MDLRKRDCPLFDQIEHIKKLEARVQDLEEQFDGYRACIQGHHFSTHMSSSGPWIRGWHQAQKDRRR